MRLPRPPAIGRGEKCGAETGGGAGDEPDEGSHGCDGSLRMGRGNRWEWMGFCEILGIVEMLGILEVLCMDSGWALREDVYINV